MELLLMSSIWNQIGVHNSRRIYRESSVKSIFAIAGLALSLTFAPGTHVRAQQAPATQQALVSTKTFELPAFTFQNGRTIRGVRIGYETHGKLNATGDNVIFLPRSYSANSRVAGRTAADGPLAVWDSLIGPNRLFDTDKYFIVASASLAALPVGDPTTVTTGPASIDPETGAPFGGTFPVYTIRDMVEADRALLQSLGVRKIHTLFGVSMGSMQGFEWSVVYPDFIDRHIALLPMPEADGFTVAWMNAWSAPILSDANWNGGNYHRGTAPTAGLVQALNIIHLHQRNRSFAAREGRSAVDGQPNPARELGAPFQADRAMNTASQARSRIFDAASVAYGARAMALFSPGGRSNLDEALAPMKARTLLVPAKSDILFFPAYAERARDTLRKLGKDVEYFEIDGEGGHFDGVVNLRQALPAMQAFISK
jgi:homoserine O-acetyltransferase/O-succinyltransferase